MDRYWSLQGPSRFIDRVLTDLKAGASVAVFRPVHWPGGCRQEVASRVGANDLWRWAVVDAVAAELSRECDPASLLARRFVVGSADHASPLHALVDSPDCEGLVIWVNGLADGSWKAWLNFLEDYDQIVRNRDAHRMQFVLDVPAESHQSGGVWPATLRSHTWRGAADPYDMQVLAWILLRNVRMPHLYRRLAVATICECAGNDEPLLRSLISVWHPPLSDPTPVLLREGQSRGWGDSLSVAPDWKRGTTEMWNGNERVHSCIVALREDVAELRRRLWTAQVSVMFPFIEQERASLIEELRPRLQLPYTTKFGVIEDARDLELSHLLRQAEEMRAARPTVQWLDCLVALRHRLAHLEPLEARLFEHPEFQRRLGAGQLSD